MLQDHYIIYIIKQFNVLVPDVSALSVTGTHICIGPRRKYKELGHIANTYETIYSYNHTCISEKAHVFVCDNREVKAVT